MIDTSTQRFASLALVAAALFGASAPLSKMLLESMQPLSLAAFLYLGCGVGLSLVWLLQRFRRKGAGQGASLAGRDFLWLGGAVVSGGIAAPVMLLWGLSGISASGASLLLSSEGALTALIAALVFREAADPRIWVAAILLLLAGGVLAYAPGANFGLSVHALAVLGACALWGLDNNLTRPISGADPVLIAMVKGLAAGFANLVLSRLAGDAWPAPAPMAAAMLLGSLSYGASLFLYVLALRHLGSARTAAHFGTAPFFGALLAVILLGEPVTRPLLLACAIMLLATWLVLSERHAHVHVHEPLVHSHRHVHDAHHQHAHNGSEGPEPHTHSHRHEPVRHLHPHLPDMHHRHRH